jgi:hypothetical protein
MSNPRRWGHAEIPLAPFQERYHQLLERGVSPSEIAYRLDFIVAGRADTSRLNRILGLKPHRANGGYRTSTHTTYGTAERLCRALDLDPVDVGV